MNAAHFLRYSLLSTAIALAGVTPADDWYRWRGPDLNGISRETDWDHQAISKQDSQLWRCNVGTGFSSIVTKSGLLYTLGHRDQADTIYCVNVGSGETVWEFSYPSPLDAREFEGGPTATPTVDDDRVYSISRQGDLFCFDARSGDVIWRQQIVDLTAVRIPGWGYAAAPLVVGDTLLINAGDAGVAVNKLTGELIWKSADKDCGYGTPTVMQRGNDTIAVIPSGRSYVAVDLKSGREHWRQRWLTSFGCNAADPIIDANRVFLSSGYNRGAALLDISGPEPKVLWKNKSMRNQVSASILIDGFLYGVDGDVDHQPKLNCVELDSGEIQWSDTEIMPGAITATRDRLIVLTKRGELVIGKISPQAFQPLARRKLLDGRCLTAPVLSNQRIFCRDGRGDVVCIDVSSKPD